jgi:hypothetical protein
MAALKKMESADYCTFQSRWAEKICFNFIKGAGGEFYLLGYNAV